MNSITNSAQRLYDILKPVYGTNGSIEKALASCLGVEDSPRENPVDIRLAYIELLYLIRQVRMDIECLNLENSTIYLEPIEEIEREIAFGSPQINTTGFKKSIPEEIVDKLLFCSSVLQLHQYSEKVLEPELLAELLDSAESLLQKIASSKLPIKIKQNLIVHLEEIRWSIITYKIRGVDGLSAAVDASLGFLVRCRLDPNAYEEFAQNDEAESLKGFWKLLSRLSDIISLAQVGSNAIPAMSQLSELIKGLLT